MSESPGYYEHLSFNAPLSDSRANAMVARLAAAGPTSIVDVGCGWGELILRLAAVLPEADLRGVDTDARLLDRGRANALQRGLVVRFDNLPADQLTGSADLVICIGSSHALGATIPEALAALWPLVAPGGRLLYGEGTWEEVGPIDHSLVWDDLPELPSVAGLVDLAVSAGFRPVWTEVASQDELFAFESGFLADIEEWLVQHDDPALRAKNDDHRNRWLHGYRNGFGFAFLMLGKAV
ncbi:MAG TPA: methyltransferase [Nocardioidaceae bacterium]|nr:methyltransferase [Nocardioidaceae bacterium]